MQRFTICCRLSGPCIAPAAVRRERASELSRALLLHRHEKTFVVVSLVSQMSLSKVFSSFTLFDVLAAPFALGDFELDAPFRSLLSYLDRRLARSASTHHRPALEAPADCLRPLHALQHSTTTFVRSVPALCSSQQLELLKTQITRILLVSARVH